MGDPFRAEDRVKTYFEAPNYDTHSVSVTKSGESIGVPTEQLGDSFDAPYPCDRSFTVSYNSLIAWWQDYVDCQIDKSQDCDLLLTSAGGGGVCRNDHYSISSRGQDIASLPASYEIAGCDTGHGGMQTAMHEAGHAFMDKGASWEHNSGYVYERGSTYHRTPMGHGGSAGDNECGQRSPDHTDGCEEMRWYKNCCVENWVHTG